MFRGVQTPNICPSPSSTDTCNWCTPVYCQEKVVASGRKKMSNSQQGKDTWILNTAWHRVLGLMEHRPNPKWPFYFLDLSPCCYFMLHRRSLAYPKWDSCQRLLLQNSQMPAAVEGPEGCVQQWYFGQVQCWGLCLHTSQHLWGNDIHQWECLWMGEGRKNTQAGRDVGRLEE